MKEIVELAEIMAGEAGKIARRYFRQDFTVEHKNDDTPVTIVDRKIEQKLRDLIGKHRPEDGIHGEEFGIKGSKNGYNWILDPIDGTKSFTIGRPVFGTLIGLWHEEKPVLGIIDQPITGERWLGISGKGTAFNGNPVKTRSCSSLKKAKSSASSPDMFYGREENIDNFIASVRYMAWGGDCYNYGLLAGGWLDIVIEAQMNFYDFAALVPVVEGAGGFIGDWAGNPLRADSDGSVIALGDKDLLNDALKALS